MDENGQGNSAQALAGIQWILDNKEKYNIKIANLSIGTNDRSINVPLTKAVNAAWDMGIVVVAAAGNIDTKNISVPPGISKKIITVGSYNDIHMLAAYRNNRGYYAYNKYMQLSDVLAPGKDIISCLSPTYSFASRNREEYKVVEENYIKMSGTSMSTPMVSGACALLLEKYPHISPNEVKQRIRQSSSVIDYNGKAQMGGLLNIGRLILGG